MFINEQVQAGLSEDFFCAAFREMDLHATQTWPWKLALDFVRAYCSH